MANPLEQRGQPVDGVSLDASGNIQISPLQVDPITGALIVTGSVGVSGVSLNLSASFPPAIASGHTSTYVTASLTSQVVLAPNPNRIGATFSNQWSPTSDVAGNAYLSIGTLATTSSWLVVLQPGAFYALDFNTSEAFSVVYDLPSGSLMTTELST